jgi:hypothetical protein
MDKYVLVGRDTYAVATGEGGDFSNDDGQIEKLEFYGNEPGEDE